MSKKKVIQLVSFQREQAHQYGHYNITMEYYMIQNGLYSPKEKDSSL
nr:hypothetical protein [Bacillus cereus]